MYLQDNQIHIWILDYEKANPLFSSYFELLNKDEKQKAASFQFDHLQKNFALRHGFLRDILSMYSGISNIEITTSKKGKPRICKNSSAKTVKFNISSSKKYAVLAFSSNYELGIDIEYMRDIKNFDEVCKQVLSANEEKHLQNVVHEKVKVVFFSLWTHKEAFLKCTGDGFNHELRKQELVLNTEQNFSLQKTDIELDSNSKFYFRNLQIANNYKAALVIKIKSTFDASKLRVKYFDCMDHHSKLPNLSIQ